MSLVKLNPYNSAVAGKEFRLNIAGMTDRKIFFTILGDDAPVVQEYIDATNDKFIEENGIVDRTADQKLDFLQGRFALQVIAVRTEMFDGKKTTQAKIEIGEGEWLPAGEKLAKRVFEEKMKFVYEPVFAFSRNRANFLPGAGGK